MTSTEVDVKFTVRFRVRESEMSGFDDELPVTANSFGDAEKKAKAWIRDGAVILSISRDDCRTV